MKTNKQHIYITLILHLLRTTNKKKSMFSQQGDYECHRACSK